MEDDLMAERIDRITTDFFQSFHQLTAEQLNWSASKEIWSIAQNLEHLILVNESYYPVIWAAFRNNNQLPFYARFDFVVRYMGRSVLTSVRPGSKRRIKTNKRWEPKAGNVQADVLKRFIAQQTSLKQLLKNSKVLFKKNCLIPSPVNSNIVYPLEVAFQVLVEHEERHLNQAKEVLLKLERR